MPNLKTILLDDSLLIGTGGVRRVYQHPDDTNKCIKITHNPQRNRSVRRELIYLVLYSIRKKPFFHLPRFHGLCTTNYGRGAIFDLLRDYDGKRSAMLSDHILGQTTPSLQADEIIQLLISLHDHLLEHQIIVSDPAPHNLMVHYPSPKKPRLVIIDGIGNPHFIKIADISKHYARIVINKKWRKYIEDNPILEPIFTKSGYIKRT